VESTREKIYTQFTGENILDQDIASHCTSLLT